MLCTESFVKKGTKATNHGNAFSSVPVNNKVMLEDEVFLKAIYVLLQEVFPALKAQRYCDSNVPAMDKIFHLVKRADDAILKAAQELDDETIFGLCRPANLSDCEDEMEEIYGENGRYSDNDR